MGGADWYEGAVVMYKITVPGVKNLATDLVAAVNAIRGKEIGSGAKCPSAFVHDTCANGTASYTCDADGFITNVLRVPSDGPRLGWQNTLPGWRTDPDGPARSVFCTLAGLPDLLTVGHELGQSHVCIQDILK